MKFYGAGFSLPGLLGVYFSTGLFPLHRVYVWEGGGPYPVTLMKFFFVGCKTTRKQWTILLVPSVRVCLVFPHVVR